MLFINLFHFSSLEKIYAVLWKLYGFTSSIYSLFRLTKLSMNYLVFDEAEETWLRCESSLFMWFFVGEFTFWNTFLCSQKSLAAVLTPYLAVSYWCLWPGVLLITFVKASLPPVDLLARSDFNVVYPVFISFYSLKSPLIIMSSYFGIRLLPIAPEDN